MGKSKRRGIRSRGRKTVLTRQLQEKICQLIRAGTYDYVAAEASGISRTTFFDWVRRGEGRSDRATAPAYVQFVNAIRLAHAEARAAAEVTVKKTDVKWWLSRMHRDKPGAPGWSDKQQVEVTGKEDAPLGRTLEMVRQFIDATDREDEKRNL
jgi:transposase